MPSDIEGCAVPLESSHNEHKMQKFATWIGAVSVVLVFLAALTGCRVDRLESEVSGKVTLDGSAIGPGFVVFAPVDGQTNPANGAVQRNGNYSLKTVNTTGLPPGRYKAAVTVLDQPPVAPGERSMVVAKSLIPEVYSDVETSGLEFDVEPGRNTIDIELTSK